MKKTLFVTMLAAALMGGQVFAEVTGTSIEGCDKVDGNDYYGKYSDTESVSGGNVTIQADPSGEVPNNARVYGGYSTVANASNNMVVMSGGTVGSVYGGNAANKKEASNNVVIVTEGSITGTLHAGSANGGAATNNRIYLVGKGAKNVSITTPQGQTAVYTGGESGITVDRIRTGFDARSGISEGNSIDIYGTGIKVTTALEEPFTQMLTFNITDGQATGQVQEAAVSYTRIMGKMSCIESGTNVELKVNDFDVKEWTPGSTITLMQADSATREDRIRQDLKDGMTVDIMRGDLVTATGTLILSEDRKQLLLTNIQGVPEPTTGTLSLLALAGLCARRRKK